MVYRNQNCGGTEVIVSLTWDKSWLCLTSFSYHQELENFAFIVIQVSTLQDHEAKQFLCFFGREDKPLRFTMFLTFGSYVHITHNQMLENEGEAILPVITGELSIGKQQHAIVAFSR